MCIIYIDLHGDQKRESDPLKLELQTTENCLAWALGTRLRSPRGTDSTLNPEPPLQPRILFIRTTECGQKLDKKAEYINVGAGQCGASGDRTEAQDEEEWKPPEVVSEKPSLGEEDLGTHLVHFPQLPGQKE